MLEFLLPPQVSQQQQQQQQQQQRSSKKNPHSFACRAVPNSIRLPSSFYLPHMTGTRTASRLAPADCQLTVGIVAMMHHSTSCSCSNRSGTKSISGCNKGRQPAASEQIKFLVVSLSGVATVHPWHAMPTSATGPNLGGLHRRR